MRVNSPRKLSHVSHSLYLVIDVSSLYTTTLRRNATASQPLLHANPRTRSLNSSSATSFPCASSQTTTLFGGYRGLRPPPTRKMRDDVWKGTANASVPSAISRENTDSARAYKCYIEGLSTSLAEQFEGAGTVHRESRLRACSEDAAFGVES